MKKFKEFVAVPKHGIGFSRDTLPQIEYNQVGFFLKYMRGQGYNVTQYGEYPISGLKSSQDDFDVAKVAKMVGKDIDKRNPLLISQDDYVMDGHHRWAAEYNEQGSCGTCKTWKFNCNILDLIAHAKRFLNE